MAQSKLLFLIEFSPLILLTFLLMSCQGNSFSENRYDNDMNLRPAYLAMLDTVNYTLISFNDSVVDLGKIRKGETKHCSFAFTNRGKTSLFIDGVHTVCGCTISSFPQRLIPPNGQGKINVEFNSASQEGYISKPIVVTSNTINGSRHVLRIVGFVTR